MLYAQAKKSFTFDHNDFFPPTVPSAAM
jgi:hypothetical protein